MDSINSLGRKYTGFSPSQERRLLAAIQIILSVPSGVETVDELRRRFVRFDSRLSDRAQTTLLRTIILGPEPFLGDDEIGAVSLAGTLVHEHWHTRQSPFWKTWSFWTGVVTRTHPMLRYERPAYARQAAFLEDLARISPAHAAAARGEAKDVRDAFAMHYSGALSSDSNA